MSKLRIALVGVNGRMGRALVQAVAEDGQAVLSEAYVREGSNLIGADAGEVAVARSRVGAAVVHGGADLDAGGEAIEDEATDFFL